MCSSCCDGICNKLALDPGNQKDGENNIKVGTTWCHGNGCCRNRTVLDGTRNQVVVLAKKSRSEKFSYNVLGAIPLFGK